MSETQIDQHLLTAIVNNTMSGIIIYTPVQNNDGEIIDFSYSFINDRAMTILKGDKSDYVGTTLLCKFPDTKDSLMFKKYIETAETGVIQEISFNYSGDGYASWYRNKIVKYNGLLIVYFLNEKGAESILEELNQEKAKVKNLISKKDELFSVILNHAFAGVFYLLPIFSDKKEIKDFSFGFINQFALSYLNVTEEQISKRSFLEMFPNAIGNETFTYYKNVYLEKSVISKKVHYGDENISGWFQVEAFAYDEGVIVYFRDITSLIEQEKQTEEKNKILKKLLEEKELLFLETHHRIKNNLQVISSLLNLQKYNIDNQAAVQALDASIQRIKTIASVHENLYRDKNFEYISFDILINEVVANSKSFYNDGNVKYKIECGNFKLDINLCVNIGFILNEIITNSLKHAFSNDKQGEIEIICRKENDTVFLNIHDNGRGIPYEYLNGKRTTLGLTLIESLVDQIEGKLEIRNDNGTRYKLIIPV